ncbi:MAG: DUF1360 domain-containing protein [Candidatus Thorarchaeota archaeon]|jgi:hypothetical protein
MTFSVSDVFRLVIYVLAVFRLTHLLWYENGPWDVFDWLRAKAGIKHVGRPIYTYDGEHAGHATDKVVPDTFFAQLLDCPLCLSMWLAVPALVAWALNWFWLDVIAVWLALAAVQLLLFGWERPE